MYAENELKKREIDSVREVRIKESDEIRPGIIADFGYDGGIVSVEIMEASRVVEKAGEMQFAVADEIRPPG